ncbi:MAG: type II toxin-antitoxin system CcdA family antitoxin [Euzebya sp.]
MGTTRTTFTLDEALAEQARRLGVNVSAAARQGVAAAVLAALARADRAAYEAKPERVDAFWTNVEAWGEE